MTTSEKVAHTPGPWAIGSVMLTPADAIEVMSAEAPHRSVAFIEGAECLEDEARANARLIAAAPDLLAALKAVHEAIGNGFARYERAAILYEIDAIVKPAIAKARGA